MRVTIADTIEEFDQQDWNRLPGTGYPFLRHEFLAAAERSGSVGSGAGWRPRHTGIFDERGNLVAAMPLYEKTHSWGEFVFDWNWAHAYERAGIEYYPKLVSTSPFTPATSRRFLTDDPDHVSLLLDAATGLAREEGLSSLHILFPEHAELPHLEDAGLMLRKDCQFHWLNGDYGDFDDFLATFSSAKRKKVRRERRIVEEQGIRFRRLSGAEIDEDTWMTIYELISITFLRRGSMPYFNFDFFLELGQQMPDSILVILAEQQGTPIAAAVFYDSEEALYGRYWGADAHYNALHFETCYYRGIEYCIERGRQRFEPGTQGEHKIARGFLPATTWSAHWLAHPEFYSAIGQYLRAEQRHIDHYVDAVNTHSPYRSDRQK
jgi:predicted N-acyltransferase